MMDDCQDYSHHYHLIEVVPALDYHPVECQALGIHQELIIQSADST